MSKGISSVFLILALLLSPVVYGFSFEKWNVSIVYAGGGGGGDEGGLTSGEAEGISGGGGNKAGGGSSSNFSASFGWADAVGAALGMAFGPVGAAVGYAFSAAMSALGVNAGVSFSYDSVAGASVGTSGNVQGGIANASVNGHSLAGDVGFAVGNAVSSVQDAVGSVGSSNNNDTGENGAGNGGSDGPLVLSQQVTLASQDEGGNLQCTNPDYPQLCGVTSCIPAGTTCCASTGYADRYCPVGSFCTTGGECESSTGGTNCVANYNQACTSSTNSCGMSNSGFYSCTGTCQATVPADSSCPTPGITLTQTPAFVNSGDVCQVMWTTTHTTSCSLVNVTTGATVASGLNNTYITPPITAQVDFRLDCKNGTVVSANAAISCRLNPGFQEN